MKFVAGHVNRYRGPYVARLWFRVNSILPSIKSYCLNLTSVNILKNLLNATDSDSNFVTALK